MEKRENIVNRMYCKKWFASVCGKNNCCFDCELGCDCEYSCVLNECDGIVCYPDDCMNLIYGNNKNIISGTFN